MLIPYTCSPYIVCDLLVVFDGYKTEPPCFLFLKQFSTLALRVRSVVFFFFQLPLISSFIISKYITKLHSINLVAERWIKIPCATAYFLLYHGVEQLRGWSAVCGW